MRLSNKPNQLRATCTAVGSALALLLMSHAAALAQAALPTETTGNVTVDSNGGAVFIAHVSTPGVVPPYMSGIVTWRDEKGKVLARSVLQGFANPGTANTWDLNGDYSYLRGGTAQISYSGDCTYGGSSVITQVQTGAAPDAKAPNQAAIRNGMPTGRDPVPETGTALTAGSGYWDQPTTLVALVLGTPSIDPSGHAPPLTGIVTFFDRADNVLGGVALAADGTARLSVQPKRLAIGVNHLRATFNGTGQYAGQISSACDSIVMLPPAGR